MHSLNMSSESDFDIEDSDEESVKVVSKSTSSTNGKRGSTTLVPRSTNKKKRSAMSDDVDFDQGAGSDDGDASDVENKAALNKKVGSVKTLTPKKSVSKNSSASVANQRATVKTDESSRKREIIPITSSSPSSSSSSSSSSAAAVSSIVGGTVGDITRGPNVTTESAAKKLILQYLKLQNRPYSAIQVFDNLHKRIAKPTVERCLTTLSETDGGLRCKEYGKAKIYFFDQLKMSPELNPVLKIQNRALQLSGYYYTDQ